jgi:hypothetical protein
MEAMFIFNLNFNKAGYYAECEQMRFYAVQDRPAEAALSAMPKVQPQLYGELSVSSSTIGAMITPAQQPFSQQAAVPIENVGDAVFTYTITANPDTLTPSLINSSGRAEPGETAVFTVTFSSNGQPTGTYSADLTVTAVPSDTIGDPVTIPVKLFIVDEIFSVYMPSVLKN